METYKLTKSQQQRISRIKREIRRNEKTCIFHKLFELEGTNSEDIIKETEQRISVLKQRL